MKASFVKSRISFAFVLLRNFQGIIWRGPQRRVRGIVMVSFCLSPCKWFPPSRSLVASDFVEEPYIRRAFRHEPVLNRLPHSPRDLCCRSDVSRVYPNLDKVECQPAMRGSGRGCGAR